MDSVTNKQNSGNVHRKHIIVPPDWAWDKQRR